MLADELKAGDLFADRYQIARLLGKGGMGWVYLAKDTRLGREIALKLPSLALFLPESREKLARRFVVEARAAAALSHPNICQVFESHEFDGQPYLTMDYIAGEPLDQLLARVSPLPPEQTVSIIRDLARALDRAHSKGIVHRDLKPSNVLICPDRGAVLTDFGLARFLDDPDPLTPSEVTMGTPAYMSPEHCQGNSRAIGPASDVFSLGIIFYELLTGRRPFPGPTNHAVMFQIVTARPRPPSAIIAGLDTRLDAVCLKALSKPLADRFTSMAALVATLPTGPLAYGPVPETLVEVVPALPKFSTNSLGMTLVRIAPGSFLMGSPDSDAMAEPDEKPQHKVFIAKPFDLGATQVTVEQFRRFVDAERYKSDAEKDSRGGYGWNQSAGKFEQAPKYTWRNSGFSQGDDHPVVNVSWNDAVAFCAWLSKKEGGSYRLPTEAEWEYACRAGTTTRYSCGDDPEGLVLVGNVADATLKAKYPGVTAINASDEALYTAAVGRYRANAWGLYDLHGNVWEWCSDGYDSRYYAKSPAADPLGLSAAIDRVIRGGSWYSEARDARSAFRGRSGMEFRSNFLGFRLARGQRGNFLDFWAARVGLSPPTVRAAMDGGR